MYLRADTQAIRALGKIGGFPSREELEKQLGDPKTVKTVDRDTFRKIMEIRTREFAKVGGTLF